MTNPRITLITPDYPPQRGGVAVYLSSLVREADGAIEVISEPSTKLSRKFWPRWWPVVGLCRREAKKGRLILVSHVLPFGTAAWIANLVSGARYAVIFHGKDIRLVQSIWKRWLLRRICRRATQLIVNSESTKRDLLSKLGVSDSKTRANPICVLTPGVDDLPLVSHEKAADLLNVNPSDEIVLSITRLVPRKGIDKAILAMAELQQERVVTYVVVGDGPDRPRLESLARDSGVNVRWILNANDEEKWRWFAAADVFLLPAREEPGDIEGFGIAYLEAAQAGIPSIAGKSGGAVEAVLDGTTGLLVDPNSVDEIATAVKRLLEHEGLRTSLGKQAKQRVAAEFRWKDRWAKLDRILK